MRYATIRRKHAQAERLWVRYMTQPQRLIVPDYSETNLQALQEHATWTIAEPSQVVPDNAHWLLNTEFGWACQGCKWTGDNVKAFWAAHERKTDGIPF